MSRKLVRYSEAFKLEVVNALERGKFENISQARTAYGINGAETVQKWLRIYGKTHLLNKVIRVEKADERSALKKAKQRIRELERALSNAHIKQVVSDAQLQIACERLGEKPEDFKKKFDLKQSQP